MNVPQPRDPFAVDKDRAVAALKIRWDDSYAIIARVGCFEAIRRHGARVSLIASTPDELERAMLADSRSW